MHVPGQAVIVISSNPVRIERERERERESMFYKLIEGRKEMFYLTTHSTHFIYDYMASDIW